MQPIFKKMGITISAARLLVGCSIYLWLVACPALGQVVTKEMIKPEHYKLWSILDLKELSADGRFVSYTLSYPQGSDTLFVMSINRKRKYAFANCQFGRFATANLFAVKIEAGIELLHLDSGNKMAFSDLESYDFSATGSKIILKEKQGNAMRLRIIDQAGKSLSTIDSIGDYKLSDDARHVAFTIEGKKGALGVMRLDNLKINWIAQKKGAAYSGITWGANDDAVLFLKSQADAAMPMAVGMNNLRTGKTQVLEFRDSQRMQPVIDPRFPLTVSDDLGRVFFAFKQPDTAKTENPNVQVWHSRDRQTFIQHENEKEPRRTKVALWSLESNDCRELMSEQENVLLFAGKHRFALTADKLKHEPQWDYEAGLDFSITDLEHGEKTAFLEKHSPVMHHVLPSPGGKYILYFRDRQWVAYDLKTKIAKSLTANLNVVFDDELHDTMQERQAYGVAGCIEDDKAVLIYDRYDIWEIDPVSVKATRLTHGREKGVAYRILTDNGRLRQTPNYSGWTSPTISMEDGLLLSANGDDRQSGFSRWSRTKGVTPLVYGQERCEQIKCADGLCVYQNQDFDLPAGLQILKGRKVTQLFRSNTQHERFEWGKAEPFHYIGMDGKPNEGFLCYPAGFKSGKTYPMVVHIYEKQYRDIHLYRAPKETNPNGFNLTQYLQNGYVVLFPDLSFKMGEPGISAVKNLELAVGKVLEMGIVDPKRIGLIGHSFGGYEANFVITQTGLFAAAVSGAGIADIESHNFSINWDTGKSDMWRYEYQQFRMGGSIFENRAAYERNNPIRYAEDITTPLLSWTGGVDTQVDWQQTTKFYMAMRRLGKQHVMLIYPGDWHALNKKENQIDLSQKVKAWFDHYLKGEPAERWILQPQN